MNLYSGNYSQSMERKMESARVRRAEISKTQLREIKRIEGIIVQQRRWNQARNFVTIASKEKQIEASRPRCQAEDAPQAIHFRLRQIR
jgi:ATP-binding cassette subfamily F protein 3